VDLLDRSLLELLQNDFSITPEPYKELALTLQVSQEEVIDRIKKLKKAGIIRRLGVVFDSRKLGYKSTLCAMSVPEERLQGVEEIVNSYSGVTHNYLRENSFNMWFTIIASSQSKLERIIAEISQKTGLKILNLPALKLFKIKVKFQIPEGEV